MSTISLGMAGGYILGLAVASKIVLLRVGICPWLPVPGYLFFSEDVVAHLFRC